MAFSVFLPLNLRRSAVTAGCEHAIKEDSGCGSRPGRRATGLPLAVANA